MPHVTLTKRPPRTTTAIDPVTGVVLRLNVPVDVDDEALERLRGLESLGFEFEVSDSPPSSADTSAAAPPAAAPAAPAGAQPASAQATPEPSPAATTTPAQ